MPLTRDFEEHGAQGTEWFAPAKVNVFLRILGRRPDGYHDLESLMVPLTLGDSLRVIRQGAGDKIDFAVDHSTQSATDETNLGPSGDNLVVRAAKAFFAAAPKRESVQLLLTKRTPIAAGLGGGSSDAATTLQALNHLFGSPLSGAILAEIGKKLGADVPFFLLGKAALARGIGEILTIVKDPEKASFVLVNPGFAVSTAWVYQNLDLALTSGGRGGRNTLTQGVKWSRLLENDLESVTLKAHPVLSEIKREFLALGADGSLMSGSGPTVFGVFEGADGKARASDAAKTFSKHAKYRVFQAESL